MKLALGTAQFGLDYGVSNSDGKVSLSEASTIIDLAVRLGIKTLDTASSYGDSEKVVGKLGQQIPEIITKLSTVPETCIDVYDWVFEQLNSSMQRLDRKKIHAVLLHSPDQLHGPHGEELYRALCAFKSHGYASKIGVSIYNPQELDDLWKRYEFDIVQAPLNIVDRRILNGGWAERLKRDGIELHIRSVFLQGLLLMQKSKRPSKFSIYTNIFEEWDSWLAESKLSAQEACLRFVINQKEVDRAVIGVTTANQLRELINGLAGPLGDLPQFKDLNNAKIINPTLWGQL